MVFATHAPSTWAAWVPVQSLEARTYRPFGPSIYRLTIGYGDFAPSRVVACILAIIIGFIRIVLTGLTAAVAGRALQVETNNYEGSGPT